MEFVAQYFLVCSAVKTSIESERLVFWHVGGGENWHELTLDYSINYKNCNHFYLKDMLFTIENHTGITKVTDITAGSLAFTVPPIEGELPRSVYLVEAAAGDILRVHKHCHPLGGLAFRYSFDIRRLDVNEISGSRCWVKVQNIGSYALFIDWKGGFLHRANDSCGVKANCIYFLKETYVGVRGRPLYEVTVERIDLETDARQSFTCPFRMPVGWFVPKLHHLESST